jgi:hypothetical protein
MTPEDLVRALCARHGLPPEIGVSYLPLVEKALAAPDDVRDRILGLIEGNLAQRATLGTGVEVPWTQLDAELLLAVARVLHNWSPSNGMLDLGSTIGRPGFTPDGA